MPHFSHTLGQRRYVFDDLTSLLAKGLSAGGVGMQNKDIVSANPRRVLRHAGVCASLAANSGKLPREISTSEVQAELVRQGAHVGAARPGEKA